MRKLVIGFAAALLVGTLCGCDVSFAEEDVSAKPVIYLYPEEKTEVSVTLDYDGELTVTYPAYEDGWHVTAYPDGTLLDADGNEYSYLFWEGVSDTVYDFSKGFCVAGEDTADFLRETLSAIGLTPEEYNEFIVYWLPKMQDNPYNLISFQAGRYTESARLEITQRAACIYGLEAIGQAAGDCAADFSRLSAGRLHGCRMGRFAGIVSKANSPSFGGLFDCGTNH